MSEGVVFFICRFCSFFCWEGVNMSAETSNREMATAKRQEDEMY